MRHRRSARRGVALFAASLVLVGGRAVGAERTSLDEGWRFFKGEAPGAEAPDFRDADWRTLDIPHDWAIEGPFDKSTAPAAAPCRIFGVGWYRKRVHAPGERQGPLLPASSSTARCPTARVWLNGQELGGRPYGYIGFAFDLTPHLRLGGGERPGRAPRSRGPVLALVSRRGHLPQRLARFAGPVHVAPLGDLRHHPATSPMRRRRCLVRDRRAQPAATTRPRDAGDTRPRRRGQAGRHATRRRSRFPRGARRTVDAPAAGREARSDGTSTIRTSIHLVSEVVKSADEVSTAT